MLDVFLARPDHLDRAIDLLRDAHRLDRHVGLEPAAEAAAQQVVVDVTLSRGRSERLGDGRCTRAMTWVPTHTSQPTGVTWTVQFSGSIGRVRPGTAARRPASSLSPSPKRLVGIAVVLGDRAVGLLAARMSLPDQRGIDMARWRRRPR